MKTAVIFILARMEITAVLYFLRKGVKLHFYSLGTIFEENMRVSRGMQSLGSGFPIGARSIPVGTRFSFGKSSVLYLLRPLTLERGCPTPDRHFSAAAEQADFVGYKLQKTRNLQLAKSGCSCVVGIGNLEAVRKDFLCQRGRKRYIKTRRSDQLPNRIFSISNSNGIVNFFGSSLMESFII